MTRVRLAWLRPLVALCWLAGAVLCLAPALCREAGAQTEGAVATGASYFGQPSPGGTPVLFVPARFRDPGEYHSPPVFSPGGREVWWTPMPGHGEPTTLMSRLVDGVWTEQAYVDFGLEGGATEVTFSPDDRRVFFLSRQPVEGESWSPGLRQNPERIWYADRTADGFGTPRPVGEAVWRHPTHWAFSVASSGNLYFTSHAQEAGEGSDIYMAPFDGITWGEPRPLGPGVNSGLAENCPFVAPDESYLLFTRVDHAHYNPDLFISRRRTDGSWGEAEPLPAPINSEATEIYGTVSPDGRYLFFLSWREGAGRPFWVDADFLRTSTPGPRIVVPATTTAHVVTDGVFSAGEWEGAFRQALGDRFEIYLLADPENLYVGFRFHEEVECTPFSEVYVATGDGRFLNLHSSGSLGEGLNDFPPEGGRTSFSVGTAVGWESNVTRTPARLQGKEYRISRARLPGTTVRLAASMSMVSFTLRESVSFPQGHGFGSADAWAELVLPPPT